MPYAAIRKIFNPNTDFIVAWGKTNRIEASKYLRFLAQETGFSSFK
jgi:hypothetical protein